MYLQSNASKVDLIPLSDASEPRVCIGGALRYFVSRVHNILAVVPGLGKLSTRLETPKDRLRSGLSRTTSPQRSLKGR